MSWKSTLLPFILFFTCLQNCCSLESPLRRQRRNLVWTPKTHLVQLIMGTGVPVPIEGGQALTIGWVFKATYFTPDNASLYTNPYVTFQKRSLDSQYTSRFDLYRSIEAAYEIFGGKGCVLRSICETAQTPFKGSSILGQILHVIFSPTSTNEVATSSEDLQYLGAAHLGLKEETSCELMFQDCKKSLLDVMSVSQ